MHDVERHLTQLLARRANDARPIDRLDELTGDPTYTGRVAPTRRRRALLAVAVALVLAVSTLAVLKHSETVRTAGDRPLSTLPPSASTKPFISHAPVTAFLKGPIDHSVVFPTLGRDVVLGPFHLATTSDGVRVFIAALGNGACAVVQDPAAGSSAGGCTTTDMIQQGQSVQMGQQFAAGPVIISGVVPDDVTSVSLDDGTVVPVVNNAWVAVRPKRVNSVTVTGPLGTSSRSIG
jgi:hypothetical protein